MAFHLHRLNLTGKHLRDALNGKARISTALSQARIEISVSAITELASSLNISAGELLRGLTDDEMREWSFYRSSATHSEQVWSNVLAFAQHHNISLRELASTTAIDSADLRKAIRGTRRRIFELAHAQRLAAVTTPPSDPDTFLPIENDHDRA